METTETMEKVDETMSSAGETYYRIQDYCLENPGKAMAIAAGVGALAGIVLIKAFGDRRSAAEKLVTRIFDKASDVWDEVKSSGMPAFKNIKDSLQR